MERCIDGCMHTHRQMNGEMNGWNLYIQEYMIRWLDGWKDARMDHIYRQTNGQMDGQNLYISEMDRCMVRWMYIGIDVWINVDGWMESIHPYGQVDGCIIRCLERCMKSIYPCMYG